MTKFGLEAYIIDQHQLGNTVDQFCHGRVVIHFVDEVQVKFEDGKCRLGTDSPSTNRKVSLDVASYILVTITSLHDDSTEIGDIIV